MQKDDERSRIDDLFLDTFQTACSNAQVFY